MANDKADTPKTNPDIAESAIIKDMRKGLNDFNVELARQTALNREFSEYVKNTNHLAAFDPVIKVQTPKLFRFWLKTVTWMLGIGTGTLILMYLLSLATATCQFVDDQHGTTVALVCDLNTPEHNTGQ